MYSIRTIILLTFIAFIFLGITLFMLLFWMPNVTAKRETTRDESRIRVETSPVSLPVVTKEADVPQNDIPPTKPAGTDVGMEYPIPDAEKASP